MTAERRLDFSLSRIQICLVHSRTNITARSNIGGIHLSGTHILIWYNHRMVLRSIGIAVMQVIVKACNTVSHSADNPVVTNIQTCKRTIGNRLVLFCRNRSTQVLTTVNTVMCRCTISQYISD